MSNLGTRWQSSAVTFGPVGRVVVTGVLLLVPVAVLARASLFGLPFVGLWCFVVLPMAFRDLWRRAPLPETDLSRLWAQQQREAAERALEQEQGRRTHGAFRDEPPARW